MLDFFTKKEIILGQKEILLEKKRRERQVGGEGNREKNKKKIVPRSGIKTKFQGQEEKKEMLAKKKRDRLAE